MTIQAMARGVGGMKKAREPEWELAIDPDTVRHFIIKARAISDAINDD
jgi:hypothetical protein